MFSETVSVAATAIQHRHAIRDALARLWKRLSRGHVRIVTFGAAGAGKTSLGTFLAGEEVGAEYRESTKLDTFGLDSTTTCSILVPPGQPGLQPSSWKELGRAIGSGRASVVIHVVCWGLEAVEPNRYQDLPEYQEGMTAEELVAERAKVRRAAEIETLGAFATRLELAPRKLSLLTVVTKQDLWWADRVAVRRHYQEGAYAQAVAALRHRLGENNFTHTVWSASLIPKNLRDGNGALLMPTAQGYDQPTRQWHAQRLLEIVDKEADHAGR